LQTLTITRPDDWHTHLRDGEALPQTCRDMARVMGRAIVMPNLVPPVTGLRLAAEYRQRILRAMQDARRQFEPLMTLYLTDATDADTIREAARTEWLAAVKLYPAGATTNSAAGARVAATITAHHLRLNRNDMLVGGIRPHYYCLPILKRREHQQALRGAAVSGDPSFFLGTDSAPHARSAKEAPCGCAGVYTAHAALELYAEVFEDMQALPRLEDFAAHFGADFYRLPRNRDRVTLRRVAWRVPDNLPLGTGSMTPLAAGEDLRWQFVDAA